MVILLITIISIYLIYSVFKINNVNYVFISDIEIDKEYFYKNQFEKYNSFYSLTIIDAFHDIRNNKTIKEDDKIYYLKKVLRESDMLIISVGMNELASNFDKYNVSKNLDYFNKMYLDIRRLINELKRYAYGKIIFLGYYNPTNYYDSNIDRIFFDMDIQLNKLMMNNDIIYIDLYELIKENNYKEKNSIYLNSQGINRIINNIKFYLR